MHCGGLAEIRAVHQITPQQLLIRELQFLQLSPPIEATRCMKEVTQTLCVVARPAGYDHHGIDPHLLAIFARAAAIDNEKRRFALECDQ
jgi:hypothetical protein